ncbi:MAG: hypothetical protein JXM70_23175 [Pirellulales bacterium]|nr:hypothetical protein [Pirellulales bacterium]
MTADPACAGFSYVQLYDVEGEVNGYLTYDRRAKVPPETIAEIHAEVLRRKAAEELLKSSKKSSKKGKTFLSDEK